MDTVAILIDGGFYIRKAKALWGDRAPKKAQIFCIDMLVRTYSMRKMA